MSSDSIKPKRKKIIRDTTYSQTSNTRIKPTKKIPSAVVRKNPAVKRVHPARKKYNGHHHQQQLEDVWHHVAYIIIDNTQQQEIQRE
jgi:hypothetical protein